MDEELLALDAALAKLAQRDPVKARLVELRYFAGMTGEQAAEILGVSPSTADRHWTYACAWLRREVQAGKAAEEKRAPEKQPLPATERGANPASFSPRSIRAGYWGGVAFSCREKILMLPTPFRRIEDGTPPK